ncbi:MAG: thymidine phosphorylase, partial [Candidatus Eisenbacteria bacterium]|nr:thymidine phosphorylase [Candidatus Latescibacterota bacterium]MBD3302064.1 thymidine phosphorylase [Candidatus Eisenbacteria bacterium]
MSEPFAPVRAILRKRRGEAHPPGEIDAMIDGFVSGAVADYQMTAWMMAILFRGMSREETARLTRAMIRSGRPLPGWEEGGAVVDKHSTGGVGDKVSLVVAPVVAACGMRVPMISGRALGHTGGTLDKLEAIPGYQVDLPMDRFREITRKVGLSIAGAGGDLAPADRRMYALRDVSGIIESPPLIVSSILSKKASARLDGLVLDVKVGAGGFLPSRVSAHRLARLLVEAGADLGMRVEACLSRMDAPLGYAIGNALEVAEAIRLLRGEESEP